MRRIICLALLAACSGRAEPTAPPEPLPEPMAAPSPSADPEGTEAAGYVGVLTPRDYAEVVAPFTATIASIDVKLGDHVDKGQSLVRLDERALREDLAIANATLRGSQAAYAQAVVERRAAAAILERDQRALRDNVVSKAEVDAAASAAAAAASKADAAAAAVEAQRAKLAQLKARLGDTHIVAPLAGRVATIPVQAGARIEDGRAIARVISSDALTVKFAIPADKLGTLAPGDEVEVLVTQPPIRTAAIVRHVAPELDPVAQMILADAELTAPPATLQAGIVCRILPRRPPGTGSAGSAGSAAPAGSAGSAR